MGAEEYLTPEARARMEIDRQLRACGWEIQDYKKINLGAVRGVAVREFVMEGGYDAADYLLFVDRDAVGVIEAKKEGTTLTGVEHQSRKYSDGLPANVSALIKPPPFAFESTGTETRFTNSLDHEPASRSVFTFYRPETLAEILDDRTTLRARLQAMPPLTDEGLWPAQFEAIRNLETSLSHGRPRALIQMATGSGKTFTAANIAYRLIKYAGARRILFLVDRANLGRQTLREFQGFSTPGDGRKFTELYNVQRLLSNQIDVPSKVVISTIQRLYSILKGEAELSEDLDETSLYDLEPSKPIDVAYNPKIPIEMFDVIIVDEAHRSIYGLWRQVLEYFDAFIIGLTATPGKQTLGFFNQNLVMEYNHERAVADGVNVDFDVYRIKTRITEQGSTGEAGLVTEFRDRQTRAKRYEQLDDDIGYNAKDLDRKVVSKDQIRTVVRAFRDALKTDLFPDRTEVPKTLIFAKDDSHADDIVQIVREEFGKGNDFAVKITYKSGSTGQKPEDLLQAFRNSYNPRIAVTVDMIATGTDVKAIECVFFMRMVRSRQFFEQMKGRGVRVINPTDLQGVTADAKGKDRFVLVDAVGVTDPEHRLQDTVPLERNPKVSFDKLLHNLALGQRGHDLVSSIASRLARLNMRLSKPDREELEEVAGVSLKSLTESLVDALDPDKQFEAARLETGAPEPGDDAVLAAADKMLAAAVAPLADNPAFREKLVELRRTYDQLIDTTSADEVTQAGYSKDAADRARSTIESFRAYLDEHKDEITALQILYSRPYKQRLTWKDVKELANAIGRSPQRWTPDALWKAYETLDKSKVRGTGPRVMADVVQIVRYAIGEESELISFPEFVNERFENWLAQQQQANRSFTSEQVRWLERIRDHIAGSLAVSTEDFQLTPFVEHGGIGKAYEVFGDSFSAILDSLNHELVA
ncbi:MAG: DEAD/DEAH box helicase family protein [Candidatus Eremiobacteraeota bacterium]|nr:DEAD/DEAH box helicase family protein [Candidatus Eremiobacteraeota bacterium]